MFLTGEQLFCSILEAEYDAFVTLIDSIINFPRMALQTIKSIIQAAVKLTMQLIRSTIIVIEQKIIEFLNLDDIDLSKTKENFCNVAWECAAIKDKIFDIMNVPDSVKNNYEEFEEVVCRQGLRSLFEDWVQGTMLDGLDQTLRGFLDDIEKVFNKVQNGVDEYIDYLLNTKIPFIGKTFLELMEELDTFAQCAFASCNWALTSTNKKEDLLADAGVEQSSTGFVMVLDEYNELILEKDSLTNDINGLILMIETETPRRGTPPDQITR